VEVIVAVSLAAGIGCIVGKLTAGIMGLLSNAVATAFCVRPSPTIPPLDPKWNVN
jgi:hypothetical protein